MADEVFTQLLRSADQVVLSRAEQALDVRGIAHCRAPGDADALLVPEAVLTQAREALVEQPGVGARLAVLVPLAIIAVVAWLIWVFGKVGD